MYKCFRPTDSNLTDVNSDVLLKCWRQNTNFKNYSLDFVVYSLLLCFVYCIFLETASSFVCN